MLLVIFYLQTLFFSSKRLLLRIYIDKKAGPFQQASQERSILQLIKGEIEGVSTRQIPVIFFLSRYYAAHFYRETAVK